MHVLQREHSMQVFIRDENAVHAHACQSVPAAASRSVTNVGRTTSKDQKVFGPSLIAI
jgi:hypothetical protein